MPDRGNVPSKRRRIIDVLKLQLEPNPQTATPNVGGTEAALPFPPGYVHFEMLLFDDPRSKRQAELIEASIQFYHFLRLALCVPFFSIARVALRAAR
jgi:hypothetical protein